MFKNHCKDAAKPAALLVAALGAAALIQPEPSFAQGVMESAAPVLEEVIVTARKRQESLLEIPESVAALSGEDIARQGIDNLKDIGMLVPNLNLSMRTDGFPNVTIRGIGGFGNTQGVGFYLDDVQVFSDASSRFGDLERVEVLKGPQGTLLRRQQYRRGRKVCERSAGPNEYVWPRQGKVRRTRPSGCRGPQQTSRWGIRNGPCAGSDFSTKTTVFWSTRTRRA